MYLLGARLTDAPAAINGADEAWYERDDKLRWARGEGGLGLSGAGEGLGEKTVGDDREGGASMRVRSEQTDACESAGGWRVAVVWWRQCDGGSVM